MLAFGGQLYDLTGRDLVTSFVDPFFRGASVVLNAGQTTAPAELTVPVDRSLYVHSVVVDLAAEAATDWESFSVNARRPGNELACLVYQEALIPTLNRRISRTYFVDLVLPPGISTIRLGPTRVTTTNAVTASLQVLGYLIPPGRINRA